MYESTHSYVVITGVVLIFNFNIKLVATAALPTHAREKKVTIGKGEVRGREGKGEGRGGKGEERGKGESYCILSSV